MRFRLALSLALALAAHAAQQPPPQSEQTRVLESLTEFAQHYTERIPNFLCIRTTRHLVDKSGSGPWKTEATTAYELTYDGKDEHYKLLSVDGSPQTKMPARVRADGWVETNGNFGWIVGQILGPKIHPHLSFQAWESVRGRTAMAFAYKIALAESKAGSQACNSLLLFKSCKSASYGFHGLICADRASGELLRITTEPDDLPSWNTGDVETIDYGRIAIGGEEYLLPLSDTFETVWKKRRFRNESDYASYRKFAAESVIKQ
jgi:hypothetical protein